MRSNLKKLVVLMVLMALFQCGGSSSLGGSEAGNPPTSTTTRLVVGTTDVSSTGSALIKYQTIGTTCGADQVIATNSSAETEIANISSDCSFELELEINKSYAFSFMLSNQFVASMIFNNGGSSLISNTFYLSSGNDSVNLGSILLGNSSSVQPETEPSSQCDADGDGVNDFEDSDDDDDGIDDDEELDCDFDGFLDDYDDDESECEDSSDSESGSDSESETDSNTGTTEARIYEVLPKNNSENVSLSDDVEFRTSCEVDESTVTATSFTVVDSEENSIECSFEVDEDQVECQHEDFTESETYTASVSGIKCNDGQTIPSLTWSWTAEE